MRVSVFYTPLFTIEGQCALNTVQEYGVVTFTKHEDMK